MSKVRVCFLGTPEFAVEGLKALLADEHFDVVGVVTQPDRPAGRKLQLMPSPIKKLAIQQGLKVLSPESLKDNRLILDEIRSWNAEVAVVVAFGQILTQEFLDSFGFGCVNVHASLLPRWRGAAPIQRAIEAGDQETGVCLQKMVKKLDAGAVLGSRKIVLDEQINSLQLHDQLAKMGADLLRVELMDYVRGNLSGLAQDESFVTYAKKIEKSESALDWSLPATALHRRVRAFVWGPGTYGVLEGKRLKIHQARVMTGAARGPVGQIQLDGEQVIVQCGDGQLALFEVQPESRAKISAIEYFRQKFSQSNVSSLIFEKGLGHAI